MVLNVKEINLAVITAKNISRYRDTGQQLLFKTMLSIIHFNIEQQVRNSKNCHKTKKKIIDAR